MKLFSPRLSLRTKIIAWSFIPTAIILLLVALTLYVAYQQVTEESVIKSDEELIRLSASELSASFEDYIDRLDALSAPAGCERWLTRSPTGYFNKESESDHFL